MSKFKVGDKVRVRKDLIVGKNYGGLTLFVGPMSGFRGEEMVITNITALGNYDTTSPFIFSDEMLELVKPIEEFIVIRRDKSDVIASYKRGDEIVRTAKAACAPSDEFNFETGAKLAFDRLMGREEPKSQPAPEPLYAQYFKHSVEAEKRSSMKIGDRVVHPIHGSGTVVGFERDNMGDWVWYMEDGDNSRPYPGSEGVLKKIAPEPKYYTGRVVCISGEYGIGKIYTVVNGRFTDKTMNIALPYKSVEHMNDTF